MPWVQIRNESVAKQAEFNEREANIPILFSDSFARQTLFRRLVSLSFLADLGDLAKSLQGTTWKRRCKFRDRHQPIHKGSFITLPYRRINGSKPRHVFQLHG